MSSDVIKEFLVSLGYKVDTNGQKKFVDGIKAASVEVMELGVAAAAAAVAVAAAVAKMANSLDDLYFSSQRTRASAENIQALDFAASQMGSSAEAATGSLEAFAKFLRINPGGENLIHSWGIQTRQTNGELRDTTDLLKDVGKVFRTMSYPQAYARASVLGIDEKTLMALLKGTDEFSDRYKEILHKYGLNVDKAAEQSHQFMLRLRDVKANAEVLGTVIGTKLIGIFDELEYRWNSLDNVSKKNIETIAKWVAGIVAGVVIIASGPIGIIGALGTAIAGLWDDYETWKEGGKSLINWGRWKTEIDLAKDGINGLVKAMHALQDAEQDTADWIGQKFAQKAKNINSGATASDRYQQGSAIHHVYLSVARMFGWDPITGKKMDAAPDYSKEDWMGENDQGGQDSQGDTDTTSANTPRGVRNNNPGNIKYGKFAQRMGATGQDADGFAIFASAEDGLKAISANLAAYGKKGVNTPSEIVHRWSTTDRDAYTQRLASLFGGDPNKTLDMSDPAVIDALRSGIVSQENGRNPYAGTSSQPDVAGASLKRLMDLVARMQSGSLSASDPSASTQGDDAQPSATGQLAKRLTDLMGDSKGQLPDPSVFKALQDGLIPESNGTNPYSAEMLGLRPTPAVPASPQGGKSLAQTTNINVYGANDPQRTALAVANEQGQVNEKLTRNYLFASAI